MKKILRSTMHADPAEKDRAKENLSRTQVDRFLNLAASEKAILDFQADFLQKNGEAPQFETVHDHFEQAAAVEEIAILDETLLEQFYDGASFRTLLEDEVEKQAAELLTTTCRDAIKIAAQGLTINQRLVRGTDEAIAYLHTAARGKPREGGGAFSASMRKNAAALEKQYLDRKANPNQAYGILTGYGIIDQATGGQKKKHFRIHAGFGGHLKSTQVCNEIVNAAVDGGWNPLLFTTEMPADDVQQIMIAIHSANTRFNGKGRPLNTFRLLQGALKDDEFDFYKTVRDDLLNNPQHGEIRVIDSSEFTTFGSVMQRTIREHAETEVDLLWIDYLTRMPVDHKYARLDLTSARNETIADAKRFAMTFDGGKGLPVCTPFQVNREGYKAGMANEGRLTMTALAQYNAAEKEADVITYIFFDREERMTSEPKAGILKARYGVVPPDPIEIYIDPDSRRMYDMSAGMGPTTGYAGGATEEEVEL